jgi:hypothetical protein
MAVGGSVPSGTTTSVGSDGSTTVGAGVPQPARKLISKTRVKNFPDVFIFTLLLIVETTEHGSLVFDYVSLLPPFAARHHTIVVSREFKQLLDAGMFSLSL